jgi:hypothetical protein
MQDVAARIIGPAVWWDGEPPRADVDAAVAFGAGSVEGRMMMVDGRRTRVIRVGPLSRFPDVYLEPGEVPVRLTVEAEGEADGSI